MQFEPLGDHAVLVTLGDSIDEQTHLRVRHAAIDIAGARGLGVTDVVPAVTSIAVHYEPTAARTYSVMVEALRRVLDPDHRVDLPQASIVEIPVCYGGPGGPDLPDVAAAHDMTVQDVIDLHTNGKYLVYMVGFMPGFAYLGGLSPRLVTPRRKSPRTAVPAGTVGIGGQQTGVYPLVSPGGWNLIGRTPLKIFDAGRSPATLLATGDHVRFRAISPRELEAWVHPE